MADNTRIEVATGIPLDTTDIDLNDEILTIDETDAVRRRPTEAIENFIRTQIGTQRTFGGGSGQIATWTEGNDITLIPLTKLPNIPTTQIINFDSSVDARIAASTVRTTGNQTIDGAKNFTNLLSGGNSVVDTATNQTIGGTKTFTDPIVFDEDQVFDLNIVGSTATLFARDNILFEQAENTEIGQLFTDFNSGDFVRQSRNSTVNTVVSGTGHTMQILLDSQGGENLVFNADPSIHPYDPVGHLEVLVSDPAIRYTLEFDVISETYPDGVTPFTDIRDVIAYDSITGALTLPTIYPAGTSFFITVRTESTNTPDQGVLVGFSGIIVSYVDTPTTFDAPSGGISFGNTSGDITSKTLDDYEEGTWTPTPQPAAVSDGVTLNIITSDYRRVGDAVFITVRMSVGANTSGQVAELIGLPYNPGPRAALNYFDDSGISDAHILIRGGSDDVNIYSGNSQVTWATISGHTNIVISGTYITDE